MSQRDNYENLTWDSVAALLGRLGSRNMTNAQIAAALQAPLKEVTHLTRVMRKQGTLTLVSVVDAYGGSRNLYSLARPNKIRAAG